MYQWARPRIAIPVHGERRHLLEHERLARELQVPEALAPRNGDLIRIAPGPVEVIDEVPSGRLYVDGQSILESDDETFRDRRRLGAEGAIWVAMAVSEKQHRIISGPDVSVHGVSIADESEFDLALEELANIAEAAFTRLNHSDRSDDETAEASVMRAVRKGAERVFGKRPLVQVSLLRV
jgi:ribonuclease J